MYSVKGKKIYSVKNSLILNNITGGIATFHFVSDTVLLTETEILKFSYRYKEFKKCATFIFIYYKNNEKEIKLDEDKDMEL